MDDPYDIYDSIWTSIGLDDWRKRLAPSGEAYIDPVFTKNHWAGDIGFMSPEDLGLADLDIPGLYFQISSWVLRYRRPSSVRYTTWWCPKCDNINVAFCSTDLEMESSCVIFCPSPRENGHGTHSILPVWVYQRSTYSSAASHLAIASRLMSSSIVQHQHLPKQYHLGPTVDIALWKKIHVDEFNSCEVRASDYSASRCIKQLDHTNVDEQSALSFWAVSCHSWNGLMWKPWDGCKLGQHAHLVPSALYAMHFGTDSSPVHNWTSPEPPHDDYMMTAIIIIITITLNVSVAVRAPGRKQHVGDGEDELHKDQAHLGGFWIWWLSFSKSELPWFNGLV